MPLHHLRHVTNIISLTLKTVEQKLAHDFPEHITLIFPPHRNTFQMLHFCYCIAQAGKGLREAIPTVGTATFLVFPGTSWVSCGLAFQPTV